MNKQGLITMLMMEKISAEVKRRGKNYAKGYEKGIDLAIKLIESSEDEPHKPVVPQFVADWIEEARETAYNIRGAIEMAPNGRMKDWLELKNVNTFAEAWVNGYEVEKEKRYRARIKENKQSLCLNRLGEFYFSDKEFSTFAKSSLEGRGFGWVFSCEGIEIQEVE